MNAPLSALRAQTHRHPMRVVTRRTGISAETLRVWERRYQVVTPARTQTGRRLYSDAEIERLHLLYRATLGGRNIGALAALPDPVLTELLRQDAEAELARHPIPSDVRDDDSASARRFVLESLRAIERFEPAALGAVLRRASVALPATAFLEGVIATVLEQMGTRWREGTLRPVHGHLAAAVVRHVLERTTVATPPPAPKLLLATVTGQHHELGALIAAAAAAAEGWSVTWLGANLPAGDIAEAAQRLRVRAVGLSLIHPMNDVAVTEELRRLRAMLPQSVELIVGGSAAASYGVLGEIGLAPIADLSTLKTRLQEIARRPGQARANPAEPQPRRRARRDR